MAAIAREVRASYAFVERNLNLVRRYWGWEVVFIIYSVVQALVIGFIGVAMGATGQGGDQLVLYLMIGSLVWSYLSTVFEAIGEMITWERWEGTLEYTFMAPVGRLTHMLGTVVFAIVYGLARTAVTLVVVTLFFNLDMSRANPLSAAAALVIASVGFVGMGISLSVLPLLFTERGAQMVLIAQSCVLLVSGVFYPIEVMPSWMQLISRASPATYAQLAMREALLEGKSVLDMANLLLPLLLVGLVTIPIGLTIFGWAERYAKRTGRLNRNG